MPGLCLTMLALLMVAGCAGAPSEATISPADERGLFVEASKDIIEYHIKAVSPDELAVNGLGALRGVDPELALERTAKGVTLRRGGTILTFAAPERQATDRWGGLTEEVVAAARRISPDVAAIPNDRLDEMIIDASLAQLDPFSRYARPVVAREHRASRDGFAGIGVTLDIQENAVRIASVMPDTPAASAGLRAGDRIVMLDGISVALLTADDIRGHLRGPVQTHIQIAVARDGVAEPIAVTLQRANIVPETVTLKESDGLAWLTLRAFNQETAQSLAELLRESHRDLGPNLRGIVLDLRDNPGGLLDQAIDVVSLFLDGGDIISTTGRVPESEQHFAAPDNPDVETLPLVVLIDGGSASASEIVAAALQDSGRAVVIGTSSFGKGTVQNVLRTANDGELTVTWAQIITPRGYSLNLHGVVPTLCTAAIDGVSTDTDVLLSQKPLVSASLAQPRAGLDDAAWTKLRALCPPQRNNRGADSTVAEQLLTDPALYERVLARMDAPRLATNP